MAGLAGSNVIYGAGMLECGMTVDYGQLLVDSDMLNMILFLLKGEEVSDETLALDEIHKIGPHGNFMTTPLSRKFMKSQSRPKFFDRMAMGTWIKAGRPDSYQVALAEAKKRLANHKPEPLSDSLTQDIRKFIEEVEKEWNIPVSNPDFDPSQGYLVK